MSDNELLKRTRQFSIRIIKLVSVLPSTKVADVLGRQLLRSGTSIGANYSEALHASSRKHFVTTLEIAQREAAETLYWLDMLGASEVVKPARLVSLLQECNEIKAMLTTSITTAKNGQ